MIAPRKKSPYPANVSLSKLLLVEGETPAHFFEAMAKHLGLDGAIEIRSFGGNQMLQSSLSALLLGHGFASTVKSIGLIRDAEADAISARKSVDSAINQAKVPAGIKCQVFILPDNSRPGMIETICLESVSTRSFFHCVDEFVTNATSHGASFPTGLAIDKSRLQIYMAAHPDPQLMPGIAASRGYWPFADGVFQDLRKFLQSL